MKIQIRYPEEPYGESWNPRCPLHIPLFDSETECYLGAIDEPLKNESKHRFNRGHFAYWNADDLRQLIAIMDDFDQKLAEFSGASFNKIF